MRDGQDIVKEYCAKLPSYRDVSDSLECVGIVGFSELPKQLNNVDILLHVKVGDWCPNAVIEALACGVPVVCPSWGGTAELIGSAGIIVKNNKWEYNVDLGTKMASAILQVYSKIEDYKTCARDHALNNFDINVVSTKYLQTLELIK
jgi:glycosyltransferase involved in cell wall biosynthesis